MMTWPSLGNCLVPSLKPLGTFSDAAKALLFFLSENRLRRSWMDGSDQGTTIRIYSIDGHESPFASVRAESD